MELGAILHAIGETADDEIDLADAALQLARVDAPEADWQAARAHLSAIAREAAVRAAAARFDARGQADLLAEVLFGVFGYRGDSETYDDPANANLLRVIARRRGLPVSLGILWLHAANAAGFEGHGIDLPRHFAVALRDGAASLVIDVFDNGREFDAALYRRLAGRARGAEALRPMGNREILLRLQNNIRLRRLQNGDEAGALGCIETMLAVAPEEAWLWGEAAGLQERLGQVAAAMRSCERFLALRPTGRQAERMRAAMDGLRTRLN